ncbi:glycosyltransferase [Neobacillus rhizosphaerae]|uniref:glycosyltransferase n=1 Tax=Neobacillus rhizosphaerae TaxID=2880965 RepID=UPI003D2AB09A
MKKILIVSHWMEIGGAERSLIGLLNSIDYSNYSVDLYLCRHTGEFLKLIPKEVNLLPEDSKAAAIAIPLKSVLMKGYLDIFIGRLLGKLVAKFFTIIKKPKYPNNIAIEYSNLFTFPFISKIVPNNLYDLTISFLEPHYIAAYKTRAKIKIAWMHTDYSQIDLDVKEGYKIWNQFDYIASISENCTEGFCSRFPDLKHRIIQIENILSPSFVKQQAAENINIEHEMELSDHEVKLLSIGRFSYAKNFDNVPDICKLIIEAGYKIRWCLIGYGGDEQLIKEKIIEAGMQDHVIILGKKENPYPYLKYCDIYVQPSRYEGKAVAVREAQMLCKPVVITNFSTSNSQLKNNFDGIIVPMDVEGCAKGIIELIRNKNLRKKLSINCSNMDYGNEFEIQKIYNLIK